MPNMKNQETLAQIKEELEGVSAVWVVDYCGLTVKEIQELRSNIRETGATMKVYKNTLMHIALPSPTCDARRHAGGPERVRVRRLRRCRCGQAVKNFAKKNPNLEIKGGLMEGAAVSAAQVEAIASLPSAKSSWRRSPVPFRASHAALPLPSMACRADWPRSRRPWPTRRKLPKTQQGGLRRAA